MKHLTGFHDYRLNESVQFFEPVYMTLFESYAMNMDILENSIRGKFVCTIDYRGEAGTKIVPGLRVLEPYVLGTDRHGNTLLRAWLIKGISRTGRINPRMVPGWRLFRVDRIRSITPTLQKYTVARKGYNPDDSYMTEVLFSATF